MMRTRFRYALTKRFQKMFWPYLADVFLISRTADVRLFEPARKCHLTPITLENYSRVREFRHESRCSEYREKVDRGEIGFFCECGDEIVGSIWATINRSSQPMVARAYMPLKANEAMIHDVVTADSCRGMGVAPFMVSRFALTLLSEFRVSRIVVDISVKNKSSLRMMQKAGAPLKERMLYLSAFGRLIYHKRLKAYSQF